MTAACSPMDDSARSSDGRGSTGSTDVETTTAVGDGEVPLRAANESSVDAGATAAKSADSATAAANMAAPRRELLPDAAALEARVRAEAVFAVTADIVLVEARVAATRGA